MRKFLLLIAIFVMSFAAYSQTFVFQENFESTPLGVTSTSMKNNNNWAVTTALAATGLKADSAKVGMGDTTYLTTNAFSTSGSQVVYLEFDQIAKVEFFDACIIEVSNNNGSSWTKVTSGYLGAGQFTNIGSLFNSTSYVDWVPANNNAIPTSSWWKHEKFDLSSYLSNASQAKIRFAILDVNNSGSAGNYGWLLDNIQVWKPSNQEASMVGYYLPYSLPSGCGLSNEVVQVQVANNGSANINGNLVVSFQREGQSAVSEIVPNIIIPYDTITYTFTNKIDLYSSVDTNYQVKFWVSLATDPNQTNDTLMDSILTRVPLSPPVINDTTIPYNTNVTLYAAHPDTVIWFDDILATNMLSVGHYYTTPNLLDTTVFYCQAMDGIPQAFYQIGTGTVINTTTSYPAPYGHWYNGAKHQMLILASELQALGVVQGDIKSLAFDVTSANGAALTGFTIKLAHTTQSALTSTMVSTGFTTCYTSTSYTDVAGWNTHVFQTPFSWNGTDNIIVETCFDNYPTGYTHNAIVNQTTTSFVSCVEYHSDGGGVCTSTSGTTYSQRPNMKIEAGSLSLNCPSIVKPVTVNISGMPLNDAGLTQISPSGGVTPGTPIPITVDLKNFGVDTIKKVKIYYQINDSLYPVYNWVGSLLNDSSETVTLTNFTFGSGVYNIKAWTSEPNDSLDWANYNDTISSFVYVCLSGTFTLGGPNSDFADFASLQLVLDSVGLCGSAVVNVVPGTYSQNLEFGSINGASATNTLTIQSSTGNPADVKLEYAASSTADNYVVKFNGASYVTLKNMTLHATGSTYAYGVEFINNANHNTLDGCYIKSDITSSSNGIGIRFYYNPSPNQYNVIKNNTIEGGYYGIYHYGSSTAHNFGTEILDNEIFGWYYYGIYSYFSDSVQIIGNYIHDGTYAYNYHLYNYYGLGAYKVMNNLIISSPSASYAYGLFDYYGNYYSYSPSPAVPGLVANNMVIMRGTTYSYGMYAYYSNGTTYSHNSISVENAATTAYGVYQYNTSSNILGQKFRNNIYSNTAPANTAYCVYFDTPASVNSSDYNDYYTTNTNIAYYSGAITSLASLQSSSGKESHSVSVNPSYYSATDLHSTAVGLNAAGVYDSLVLYDYDGELRDTLTPDIGADEFILLPNDAGIITMVSPVVSCPGDTSTFIVSLRNYGTDTLQSAIINWSINNVTQPSVNFSGNILASQTANVTLGTYVFSAGVPYDLQFWTTMPNGVVDLATSNDSVVINGYKTAIPAGTYTIGHGATADYADLNTVIQDLNNYGICGPVIFEFDTGTYNGNIVLDNILGASSVNTITFRSANGDSSSVILEWTPSGASDGAVTLKNMSYVTVEGLTFNVVGTTSLGKGVYLEGNTTHNTIKSNIFTQPVTTNSNVAGLYLNNSSIEYNQILNNTFSGGYYGAYVRGTSTTSLGKGNMLDNNTFEDFYYYGVYAYYQDSLMIRGNIMTNSSAASYPRGIYSYYSDGAIQYTGNRIILTPSSYGYGIYMYYSDASSNAKGLIANNMISIIATGNTSTSYGMYIGSSTYHDIYYNSLKVATGYSSNRGLYLTGGSNFNLANNIFVSDGYAYYISTTSAVLSSDYNDLYTTGTYYAYWSGNRTDLAALKTASGMEAHSMSIDPNFMSSINLNLITSPIDGMGTPVARVTTDIQGDLRDTLNPDMGADEFDPPAQDITVFNVISPENGCGMTYENVTVQARNTGLDTIQGNLVLKYSKDNGVNVVSESVTAIIPPQDTITYTFNTQIDLTTSSDVTYTIKVWGALPQDVLAFNDSATVAVFNGVVPPSPTLSGVQSAYGTTATLSATASGIILWYDSINSVLPIGTGANYTTPVLFDTTVFYCGALGTNGCVSVRVPDTVYVTGIPAGDVGISAIHTNEGCGLDSMESITIDIHNQGTGTVTTGLTARFKVDNNSWITPETVSAPIAAGATIQYTFTTKANLYALYADTLYNIYAAVTLTGDPYHVNDSLMQDSILSKLTPSNPVVTSPVSIAYGATATLNAVASDTIMWFAQQYDSVAVGGGSPYVTPPLYQDTVFWAQAGNPLAGSGANIAPLAIANASTCNTGPCSTLNDLNFGTCGTQQMWISTSSPPDLTPGVNFLEFTWTSPHPMEEMTIHHAQDNARFLTGATMQKWDGSNWVSFYTFSNLPMQCINTVSFPLVVTDRLRLTSFQMTGTGQTSNPNFREIEIFEAAVDGCTSDRIPVTINVAPPPAKDAGMYSIVNPVGSVQSGINVPVQVKIKNFGTDTLTSTTITYMLDGVVKANYNWTGSIPFNGISNDITVYTDNFAGGLHTMKFYVTGANGTTQAINANDTISSTFSACMSGTFTIGDTTKDFQSFNDALNMLSIAGICGNVLFLVDSGSYTEQLSITAVTGMDANNTVTFQSATGDSTDVLLQYAAASTADNYVVKLDGAEYFSFKNMTIQASGSSYGYVIVYGGESKFNLFEGCIIKAPTGTSSYYVPVYSSNGEDKFNTFKGNLIQNGYYSCYIRGTSTTAKEIGTTLENNIIENFYYYGVYSYYADSLIIKNNIIRDGNNSYNYPRGLYLYYGGGAFEYVGNNITLNPASYGYGMYMYQHASTATQSGLVANNMVSINGGTGTSYGIYTSSTSYTRFYNNSINMVGGTSSNRALYLNAGTNNDVINNVLNVDGLGYPYYVSATTVVDGSDYNVYNTAGTYIAYWGGAKTTLAALQSANSQDSHSKVADPQFFSNSDLHTSSVDLNGAGYPLTEVPVDIDGETRNSLHPDIGADEFTPPQWDAGIVNIESPTSPLTVGTNAVKVTLRNFGLDTLTTASIGWSINGASQTSYSFTGNLPTGDTLMNLNIGSFTAVAGANTIKAWTSMPNNHADQLNINDTSEVTLIGCTGPLGGVYTVGGTTADFPDFSSAVDALNYCGVNDTVVFLVNSGTYTEQIKIGAINGVSDTSFVVFTAVTGDSTDVLLTYAPSSAANYAVYLNGADYIHFDHMTIEVTGTVGYTILVDNGANYNSFTSCIIKSPYSTSSTVSTIYSSGSNDNYNVFAYNEITGGYYCIYWRGSSSASYDKGSQFYYNTIKDFYYYGTYIYGQDSLIFDHNYVSEGNSTVGYYPTYFYYCNNYYEISNNEFDFTPTSYCYGLRVYYCTASSNTPGRVFNNTVSITSGTGASYGLYIYYSNYVDVMFNSVNITSGSTSSRDAYLYNGSNIRFMNNSLVTNTGYTYYAYGSSVTAADHNNLYGGTSGINAYWNGSTYNTLALLQGVSMMDSNSVSVDPGYYSSTDLHATNPVIANSGTPFGNVTTDMDGDIRSTTAPSIGADEFASLANDAAAYSITQPSLNYAAVTTNKTVEAIFRNFGSDTITSMTLGYKYGSNNPVTQSWTGVLLAGGALNFTFTTPFTVQAGTKQLCVFVVLTNDQDHSNDTVCMNFTGMPLLTLSYFDNFDGSTNYWAQEGNVWQRGAPAQTTLNAAYSAPNAWMTKLNANYPDATSAYLYSPFFDVANVSSATLKFRQKRKISTGDQASVQYSTDGGQTWILLGYWGDPAATNWYNNASGGNHFFDGTQTTWVQSTYDLSTILASVNTPIQFRFVMMSNASGNDEGWLIDDFSLDLPIAQIDGAVTAIPSPVSSIIGTPVTVKATVKNQGSTTLTSIPMRYTVNGGTPVLETWTPSPSLAAGDTLTYTFTTTFTSPGTAYQLCVATQIANDAYPNNDQLCKNVNVTAAPLDAGVSKIVSPIGTAPLYTPNSVTIRIKNYGTTPMSTVDVQYKIGTSTPVVETWSGTALNSGDSVDYTFQTQYNSPVGQYLLCAKTLLTGDMDNSNDEKCETILPDGIVEELANGMKLWQNMPNPASDNTIIRYEIPAGGQVVFELVDVIGNTLMKVEQKKIAGVHTVELDANQLANGIYYYTIEYDGYRLTKQMIINR